ncbi:multicopper oxidase domain-containing protein [Thioclava sp. GXIMD4216]|uniref:multicopper oxidase family protein n=1 Tax=Thioclava sp. GXIMD4216 TaxID=3131929 RepID=UPI0030CB56D3
MTTLTRRGFLAASVATSAGLLLPARVKAQGAAHSLKATTRTLEVNGRAATVMGLVNAQGTQGLTLAPGERFRVDLTNDLDMETIIHWHGQIPPNAQDGAPNTNPMLEVGEIRAYDFAPRAGTFWMHSHVPQHELGLLAAPLIVRSAEEQAEDRREVVMFLHDFSFLAPEEVLDQLAGGHMEGHDMSGHQMGGGSAPLSHQTMSHGNMSGMDMSSMTMDHSSESGMDHMSGMAMDLNDFEFDAYLANDRTLDDPEVVTVEKGGRVRLRVINGSSMTAYWLDLGALEGALVAVDGEQVQPVAGSRFPISPAQRMDILVDLPAQSGAYPVLAKREGSTKQTGLVLASAGATIAKLSGDAETETPAATQDLDLEYRLRAVQSLPAREVSRHHDVMLGGSMDPYRWTINGQVWANHAPIPVIHGERVEMTFHNMSMMAHPMHLHGHVFQVVAINGRRFAGARRDTVVVPPMSMVTIAFDAGETARWMLHCHHMGHLATGMMTELQVTTNV